MYDDIGVNPYSRKVNCPICGKYLMSVGNDKYIDFDMRHADQKIFCVNCKRKIKYREIVRHSGISEK